MKFGLEQNIIDTLITIFEQNSKLDKALVFGSRAKGNYRPDSDIDIAIKGQDLNTDDIIAMSVAFEEKGITYKIDLINYHTIKEPDLKDHIDRVGIELYSRWRECKLVEIANVQTGPFGSQLKNEQYITGGTPVVTVEHIKDFKIVDFDYPSVTKQDKQRLSRYLLQTGDIIFTRVGSVDLSAYVKPHQDGWMFSSRMLRVRPHNNDINSRYLSYYFQQPNFREYIINISVGATMPSINTEILKGIPISYPPNKEQTAIASILSSLDDKIDLLHRQNKTLEGLAETLFRQWFVEEAEESWEEITLSEIADHSKENIHPSKNPTKLYKHYSLPAFDAGKEPILEIGKEILSNKYKVISNSILVSKLNPRTPRIWMIYGNVNEDESICSTEFQIVKPKDQKWYGFIYCFLKSYNVTQELAGASSGTSGSHQRVNPQDIFNLTFFKPTDILVEKFSVVMDNYLVKINNNQTQIRTLTNTRDALLPKLMSGEVRVNL